MNSVMCWKTITTLYSLTSYRLYLPDFLHTWTSEPHKSDQSVLYSPWEVPVCISRSLIHVNDFPHSALYKFTLVRSNQFLSQKIRVPGYIYPIPFTQISESLKGYHSILYSPWELTVCIPRSLIHVNHYPHPAHHNFTALIAYAVSVIIVSVRIWSL